MAFRPKPQPAAFHERLEVNGASRGRCRQNTGATPEGQNYREAVESNTSWQLTALGMLAFRACLSAAAELSRYATSGADIQGEPASVWVADHRKRARPGGDHREMRVAEDRVGRAIPLPPDRDAPVDEIPGRTLSSASVTKPYCLPLCFGDALDGCTLTAMPDHAAADTCRLREPGRSTGPGTPPPPPPGAGLARITIVIAPRTDGALNTTMHRVLVISGASGATSGGPAGTPANRAAVIPKGRQCNRITIAAATCVVDVPISQTVAIVAEEGRSFPAEKGPRVRPSALPPSGPPRS
jgi:hypothetical protein